MGHASPSALGTRASDRALRLLDVRLPRRSRNYHDASDHPDAPGTGLVQHLELFTVPMQAPRKTRSTSMTVDAELLSTGCVISSTRRRSAPRPRDCRWR